MPRLGGGGAGQGARRTGTAATPAAHPRAYKQNVLGKVFAKESWESSFLFSHPRLLLSFQKETEARLFFPAVSFPTLPSPDPALAVRLSSQDLKGGESSSLAEAQPSAGRAEAAAPLPLPRGRGARSSLGSAEALPKPAHSPCPISLPRARELAATSSGQPPRSGEEAWRHPSESGSEPGREMGRGWTETELEFPSPRASGVWGPGGEAERKRNSQAECSHSHR